MNLDDQIKAVRQSIRDLAQERNNLQRRKDEKGDVMQSLLDDLAVQSSGLESALQTLQHVRTVQAALKQLWSN